MKTMILVKGAAEKGKSQSIKRVAMTMPFSSIIKPWPGDDYDSYIIGTVTDKDGNERIVGIESQGDPNSNQKEWIEECVKANCEVIIAASRSFGQTVIDAKQLAKNNGYEMVQVTTLYHESGPKFPNGTDLRDVFAENIVNLVMKCLE